MSITNLPLIQQEMIRYVNNIDFQTQSIVYCKIRLYFTHVLGQYLRFCIVFVCLDRFLATRTNARIRSIHSLVLAKKLLLSMCFICPLIAVHLPILMNIRNNVCSQFDLYKLLYAIYQLLIVGILPPVLMSVFSILTVVSLHRRHGDRERARQRDRHLMRMVIAEVVLNVLTSIPYSLNLIYGALTYATSKTTRRIEIETFITFVTIFSIYLISVTPFYLFLLTSKSFREEFKNLFTKFWSQYILRQTRIVPIAEQHKTVTQYRPRIA